jgi:hypothetical protein
MEAAVAEGTLSSLRTQLRLFSNCAATSFSARESLWAGDGGSTFDGRPRSQ